jgi:hypothetical protein
MNKRQVVLGAALTALVAAGTTLKTSTAQADDHAAQPAAAADKNSCKAKDSCKGKKKPHAAGEEKDKNACKGKNGCAAKAEEKK